MIYGYILFIVVKFTGLCLYLSKEKSKIEAYECTNVFKSGCPEIPYRGSTIYKCKTYFIVRNVYIFLLYLHQLTSYNTRDCFMKIFLSSFYKVVIGDFLAYFL